LETKKCSQCGKIKYIQEFDKRSDRALGVRSACKQCRRKRRKVYEDKNREKIREWKRNFNKNHKEEINSKSKLYRDSNKERISNDRKKRYKESDKIKSRLRNYSYLSNYGITLEKYNELFEKQNGVCAICGTSTNKPLYIDHNHKTGEVRGLLCVKCNSGIGFFMDNSHLLISAIRYLDKNYE
jgi:hypothetical protein